MLRRYGGAEGNRGTNGQEQNRDWKGNLCRRTTHTWGALGLKSTFQSTSSVFLTIPGGEQENHHLRFSCFKETEATRGGQAPFSLDTVPQPASPFALGDRSWDRVHLPAES